MQTDRRQVKRCAVQPGQHRSCQTTTAYGMNEFIFYRYAISCVALRVLRKLRVCHVLCIAFRLAITAVPVSVSRGYLGQRSNQPLSHWPQPPTAHFCAGLRTTTRQESPGIDRLKMNRYPRRSTLPGLSALLRSPLAGWWWCPLRPAGVSANSNF